jgi:hypothetical protein
VALGGGPLYDTSRPGCPGDAHLQEVPLHAHCSHPALVKQVRGGAGQQVPPLPQVRSTAGPIPCEVYTVANGARFAYVGVPTGASPKETGAALAQARLDLREG